MIRLESKKVLVIGGGAAGMATASKAKRTNPNLDITVVEKSNFVSYAPCGIPYFISGVVESEEKLVHYKPEYFIEKRGIDVRTKTSVEYVDLDNRIAGITDSNGKEEEINFDILVIATGAKPIIPPIEGVDLEGIYTVRLIEDGLALKKILDKVNKVTIVGGGYIGLELAESFRTVNKKVTLIEMLDHVLPNIDPDMAALIHEELERNGVELKLGEKVVGFEGNGHVKKVLTEKGEYETDIVVLAVGVQPQTELFQNSKLEFGVRGSIKVNDKMQTNIDDIYAVGDVAESIHIVTGKPTWIPLAQTANKMGRVAGSNIAGQEMRFPGVLGTALTKVMGLNVGRTGLSTKEAMEAGFNVRSVKIEARTKANYYPGGKKIVVKLIYDEDTKLLLGGQIITPDDPAGRTNVIATALYNKMKVDELFFVDLGYAPPFAPVWDPLVVASSIAMRD